MHRTFYAWKSPYRGLWKQHSGAQKPPFVGKFDFRGYGVDFIWKQPSLNPFDVLSKTAVFGRGVQWHAGVQVDGHSSDFGSETCCAIRARFGVYLFFPWPKKRNIQHFTLLISDAVLAWEVWLGHHKRYVIYAITAAAITLDTGVWLIFRKVHLVWNVSFDNTRTLYLSLSVDNTGLVRTPVLVQVMR